MTFPKRLEQPVPATPDQDEQKRLRWGATPRAREKNLVQRAAMALLDVLAPEKKAPSPRIRSLERIAIHRTPNGCVLQGDSAALSVSWFAESTTASPFGELHVVAWLGVVSRRGSPPKLPAAEVVTALVFYPIEFTSAGYVWRDAQGVDYDAEALAGHCLALLEGQLTP